MPKPILTATVLCLLCLTALLLTAAAQPDTACEAPLPSTNRFGVVEQLTWRFLYPDDETLSRALGMMREAGVRWVRLNWSWKDFQPEPGEFIYDQFDRVARLAAEHEIELLPILTAVPAWASTAPPELIAQRGSLSPVDRYRPRDLDDWLTYVQTVVERYDGDGVEDAPGSPRLSQWEIWNEPNLALFWPPQPDAAEYLELLAATSEIIRQTDPTARVVLGGLSGSGVNAEGTGYLQQLYHMDGAQYFNVVSIHHYLHPVSGDLERLQESLAATRRVMNENGHENAPLWLTEIGWSDTPNAWGQPTASPDQIAAFLQAVYTAPLEADKIFWYNFRNVVDDSPDVEHNFGLIRHDFTPKPAFTAYHEATTICR